MRYCLKERHMLGRQGTRASLPVAPLLMLSGQLAMHVSDSNFSSAYLKGNSLSPSGCRLLCSVVWPSGIAIQGRHACKGLPRCRSQATVPIVNWISMATALAPTAALGTARVTQRAAQAFKPAIARIAVSARQTARINRCKRGSLQVVAVRVENEEVALGTVAPDFEVTL